MYKPSNLDSTYDEWLKHAHLLEPPFDYFSFADLVLRDNRITNVLYKGILTKHTETASKYLVEGIKALKLFESRSKKNSAFYIAYEAYWSKREEDDVVNKIRKRQLEGATDMNNDIVSNMERIIKKSCTTDSSASSSSSRSAVAATSSSEDEKEDVLKTIKQVDKNYGDLNVLHLDNSDVIEIMYEHWSHERINHIKLLTEPPIIVITEACKDLLSLINCSTGTATNINTQIRRFIGANNSLDALEYADYYFAESILQHFLNMMTSPRNPILFSMKERTAAPITTIYLLHILFLSCNDLVSFNWIERTTEITGAVKWDGICFSIKNRRFTPVLIEFSGGIDFNSTTAKEQGDEEKMIKSMIKMLEYEKYIRKSKSPVPQYYCRFFGKLYLF
ncbi:hypothetical protein BDF21DRAFT_427064 [Thamnidium elegans]|nr:hypothetical protein BDF21DRAFT_427064 [Thamnidium elegans]